MHERLHSHQWLTHPIFFWTRSCSGSTSRAPWSSEVFTPSPMMYVRANYTDCSYLVPTAVVFFLLASASSLRKRRSTRTYMRLGSRGQCRPFLPACGCLFSAHTCGCTRTCVHTCMLAPIFAITRDSRSLLHTYTQSLNYDRCENAVYRKMLRQQFENSQVLIHVFPVPPPPPFPSFPFHPSTDPSLSTLPSPHFDNSGIVTKTLRFRLASPASTSTSRSLLL